MRVFDDSENDRHRPGDLNCSACEQPAKPHFKCGGVFHVEKRATDEDDGIYIYRCDNCEEYG